MDLTTIFELILLPFFALLVGIIAAMLGIGGGVFIVPALQLLPLSTPFSFELAAGTSLTIILLNALSATIGYTRQKRVAYKVSFLLALTTIPGAFLGAYLADIIAEELLVLIFALFLLYVASRMIFSYRLGELKILRRTIVGEKCRLVDADGKVFEYSMDMKLGLFLSFFAGVSSGLLGIGGGILIVPILHFALCFPMHLAVATSIFTMVFTSISGASTHFYLGNVQLDYALVLSVGVIFGAQIGAHIAKRVSSNSLRRIFGVVLVLVSLRMILKLLGWA